MCSKNKYVNSLVRQDADLLSLGRDEADSFQSVGRGSVGPHYSKSLAERIDFSGHPRVEMNIKSPAPLGGGRASAQGLWWSR